MLSFTEFCIFCLFSGVVCSLVVFYLRYHFDYWRKCGVPGPRPHILVGTFPKTSAVQCNVIEELHEIYLRYKSTQKFVGIFTARSPKLFICDPKLAAQILTQHFRYFHDNESSQWTNTNVELMRTCSPFVTTGDNWKMRRSELVPALTINRIRCFYPAMRDSAQKAIEFLTAANARPQNAKEVANRFAAQFMCHFIWSIEANAFCDPTKGNAPPDWLCPLQRMADAFISQSFKCVRYFIRTDICPWLRKYCPVRFFPAFTDRFFQQLLVDSLEVRVQQVAQGNKVGRYGLRGDVVDHLQRLMDIKSIKDVLQIAGHTTTVLIDGYETTAMLVAHCLLLLARNPRVQQKLRDELISADVADSFDALNRMPYLDQCLHETLRLFPPLPSLFKLCTETITLQNADRSFLTLHPGDAVYISTYSFHRDPDYFENPETFWPERFAEELGGVRKYREMGVFMPFGDGPRMCPGRKLGLAEVKVIVSELIKNFLVTCGPNTRSDNKLAADSFLLMLDGDIELVFERLQ